MSEVGNPQSKEVAGVSIDNPTIREYTKNMAKMGISKEEAMKRIGMPMEVIDRYYREAAQDKK